MGRVLRAKKQQKKNSAGQVKVTSRKFKGFSHADMDVEFYRLGGKLRRLSSKGKVTFSLSPTTKDYRTGSLKNILNDVTIIRSKTGFGRRYRRVQLAQDELLSTSSVRELMSGIYSKHNVKLSAQESKVLENLFENISRVRFPTSYTGFALKGDIMQHPTSRGSGFFTESSKTMSRHNELDLQRKQEAAEAMVNEANKPGATAESIINAGMRAAIGFTLNEFVAPVTAADVQPFAEGSKKRSLSSRRAQVMEREKLKEQLVRFGGVQERGRDNRMDREWGSRRGLRSASPVRR